MGERPKGLVRVVARVSILDLKLCWIFAITAFWHSIVAVRLMTVLERSWYWELTCVRLSTDLVTVASWSVKESCMFDISSAVLFTCCSNVAISYREMKLVERRSWTCSYILSSCTVEGSVKGVSVLSRVPVIFVYVRCVCRNLLALRVGGCCGRKSWRSSSAKEEWAQDIMESTRGTETCGAWPGTKINWW